MSAYKLVELVNPIILNLDGGLTYKGTYASGDTYDVGDVVFYAGSSYVAIQSTTGNTPTNTTYWQIIAQAGGSDSQLVLNETPVGVTNATNAVYTTAFEFAEGSTRLFLNGQRMQLVSDYIESGANEITFTHPPHNGDILIIDYLKV